MVRLTTTKSTQRGLLVVVVERTQRQFALGSGVDEDHDVWMTVAVSATKTSVV
jgi:hypothetical protein